jgi:glycosyltransferase involved in cell wall biosynthesis
MVVQYQEKSSLLHVLCEVRKTTPNVLLMLVGDADNKLDSTWFRERIEHMGLADWVWVTGWMPREQALRYVKCAEVGLSPIPRGELFDVSSPTKAVEYLALSIPCVGNDIPDQRLVIEQSGGGLCVPMEVPAFASAISQLLDDAEHAARLGAQGRRWVFEHRAYRRIAEPIADVYIRLLGTGRRASVSARVGS